MLVKNKVLNYILKILVGAFFIFILIRNVDFNQLKAALNSGDFLSFFLSMVCFSIAFVFIQGFRLHILIRKISRNFAVTLKILMVSLFFNNFLPSNIGGDSYKIIYLKKILGNNWGKPFTLVVFERLCGLSVLIVAGITYLLFHYIEINSKIRANLSISFQSSYIYIAIFFAIALALFIVFKKKWKKIKNALKKFFSEIKESLKEISGFTVCAVLLLSILFHFLRLLGFFYLTSFFQESITLDKLIFVLFLTAVISLLPVSLGALGIRESTIAFSLVLFGVSKTNSIGIAFINRLFLYFYSIIGVILFLNNKRK